MHLNNPETKLEDLIIVQKKVIPADICDYIICMSESESWEKHKWYTKSTENKIEDDRELEEPSVYYCSNIVQNILDPYILKAKTNYISKVSYNEKFSVSNNNSLVRINRYDTGNCMQEHCDHIYSLFSSSEKGIPVLSMIIGLNSDYEGGELVFWGEKSFKLLSGDIIMWPSLFLYPHQVHKVAKNKRYSGVCWFW